MSINQKNTGRILITAVVAITIMMILTSVRVMAGAAGRDQLRRKDERA